MNKRIGALAGWAFLILSWSTTAFAAQTPAPDAAAGEWIEWYAGSAGGIQATAYVFGLAVLALAVWYGGMRQHVWRAHESAPFGPIATIGLSVAAIAWLGSALASSAIAVRIDELDGDIVTFGAALAGVTGACGYFGWAALMAGITAQAQQSSTLPRWLVVVGWIGVASSLVAGLGVATDSSATMGPVLASWVVISVWVAGTSVAQWSGAPVPETSEAPAAGRPAPAMSGIGR